MTRITIDGLTFELRSDESTKHVEQVADKLSKMLTEIRAVQPNISAQKVALLAALHFASQQTKTEQRLVSFREEIGRRVSTLIGRLT